MDHSPVENPKDIDDTQITNDSADFKTDSSSNVV